MFYDISEAGSNVEGVTETASRLTEDSFAVSPSVEVIFETPTGNVAHKFHNIPDYGSMWSMASHLPGVDRGFKLCLLDGEVLTNSTLKHCMNKLSLASRGQSFSVVVMVCNDTTADHNAPGLQNNVIGGRHGNERSGDGIDKLCNQRMVVALVMMTSVLISVFAHGINTSATATKLQSHISGLEASIAALQEKNAMLKHGALIAQDNIISKLTDVHSGLHAELERTILNLTNRGSELEDATANQNNMISSFAKVIAHLHDQDSGLQTAIANLTGKHLEQDSNSGLQCDNSGLEASITHLKGNVIEQDSTILSMTDASSKLHAEINRMAGVMSGLSRKVSSLTKRKEVDKTKAKDGGSGARQLWRKRHQIAKRLWHR